MVSTIFPPAGRRASTCTGSAARCPSTCASAWSSAIAAGRASARTASSTCTTASSSPTRWARAARLRLPRARAHARRSSRRSATGRRRTGPARTGTHRYTAEQFGLSDAQIRSDYDFYIRHFDVDASKVTTTSDTDIRRARCPAGPTRCRRSSGVGDNLIATWRPDGATEAEVQDMNKLALSILAVRLPVPRLHRRPPAGVHAAVELRVQPGRTRPRLRVLDRRDRPARASTGSPGSAAPSRFVEITQQAHRHA